MHTCDAKHRGHTICKYLCGGYKFDYVLDSSKTYHRSTTHPKFKHARVQTHHDMTLDLMSLRHDSVIGESQKQS